MRVNIGSPVVRTDGRSAVGVRSRDYQIFWDGWIYLAMGLRARGAPLIYRKIPKISPGAYIFQRPFLRGLSTKGKLRFKINWAGLIVGMKCTIFALFYFVFEGNFQVEVPRGAYIWRNDSTEGFLLRVLGLIFGGAYTWRGLFSEFYGTRKITQF